MSSTVQLVDRGRALVRALVVNAPVQAAMRALARRVALPPWVWRRLPAADPATVWMPGVPDFTICGSEPRRRQLQWLGVASDERESMPVWSGLAARASTVVDIGANVGTYTFVACASSPHCRVIAFEPVPELARYLDQTIRDNGWTARCESREVALSDHVGRASFNSTGQLGTMSSLSPDGFRGKRGELISVRVSTLDQELGSLDAIDLVKIDVEGFEPDVLRGMTKTLSRQHPTVLVECLPDGPYVEVGEILAAYGYRLFHLRHDGIRGVEHIVPDPREIDRNFLAVAREDVLRRIEALST
jgi:FkbM family methyltransferase